MVRASQKKDAPWNPASSLKRAFPFSRADGSEAYAKYRADPGSRAPFPEPASRNAAFRLLNRFSSIRCSLKAAFQRWEFEVAMRGTDSVEALQEPEGGYARSASRSALAGSNALLDCFGRES